MFRRQPPSPELFGYEPAAIEGRPSKVRPLAVACLLLSVAIIAMLLLPTQRATLVTPNAIAANPAKTAPALTPRAQAQAPAVNPAAPRPIDPEPAHVTRASATLTGVLVLPDDIPVSQMLRRPVRLSQRQAGGPTLRDLTQSAMAQFGADDPKMQAILQQALADRKSNSYIDALLNTSLTRGDIRVPAQLKTTDGRLDTPQLLRAVLNAAGL